MGLRPVFSLLLALSNCRTNSRVVSDLRRHDTDAIPLQWFNRSSYMIAPWWSMECPVALPRYIGYPSPVMACHIHGIKPLRKGMIIWLSIGYVGINFSSIWIKIQSLYLKMMPQTMFATGTDHFIMLTPLCVTSLRPSDSATGSTLVHQNGLLHFGKNLENSFSEPS